MSAVVWRVEYVVLYSWDGELPVERWQIKSVGRDIQTFINVVNITSAYFVRVHARNSHGFGPKSDVVRFRVTPPSSEFGNVVNIFVIITSGYATMVHGRGCNPHRSTTTFANLEITSL